MSKQIYIDSNGNEIQVSGTVNTADMMPMSGNDSTKVSEAIGTLSTLTTTDKSSLVGAVNEVNGSALRIAKYSFTKSINATTEATFAVTRTDFNLPAGAKVIDGFLKQSSYISTNNVWAYACNVNQTGANALQGAIYNPTNANRNYDVMATVFYTLS